MEKLHRRERIFEIIRQLYKNHFLGLDNKELAGLLGTSEANICRDIALTHHENWDGTGYPGWVDPLTEQPIKTDAQGKVLGRVGEEIPLTGRIVALADVYDALCSKRVYKEPWPEDRVLTEIRALTGAKFDPELVEIFFEILPNIKQIRDMYPEAE